MVIRIKKFDFLEEIDKMHNENPIIKKGKCPLCGEEMIEHIIKEGARFHVHRYSLRVDEFGDYGEIRCSTPNCEDNHGYGKCVPRTAKYMKELEESRKRMERILKGKTKGSGMSTYLLMEK